MAVTAIIICLCVFAFAIIGSYAECEFNGKMYSVGETIPDVCSVFTCNGGGSFDLGGLDDNCDTCSGTNGFTVRTFDEPDDPVDILSAHCRFSFAQEYNISLLIDETIDPQFGVFSEFQLCGTLGISPCLNYTFFRTDTDGINDVVIYHSKIAEAVMTDGSTTPLQEAAQILSINGEAIPVIAWLGDERGTECAFLQGPQFTAIVCPETLLIKVQPILHEQVAGLCGYYDGNGEDDRILRDGSPMLDPYPILYTVFAHGWTTKEQDECSRNTGFFTPASNPIDEFTCPSNNSYAELCETLLFTLQPQVAGFSQFILNDFCVSTLCSNAFHLDVIVPVMMEFVKNVLTVELDI